MDGNIVVSIQLVLSPCNFDLLQLGQRDVAFNQVAHLSVVVESEQDLGETYCVLGVELVEEEADSISPSGFNHYTLHYFAAAYVHQECHQVADVTFDVAKFSSSSWSSTADLKH